MMDNKKDLRKKRVGPKGIILVVVAILFCWLNWNGAQPQSPQPESQSKEHQLKRGTKIPNNEVSTQQLRYKWVIVTTVDDNFFDFFVNWMTYYERLGLGIPVYVVPNNDAVVPMLSSIKSDVLHVLTEDSSPKTTENRTQKKHKIDIVSKRAGHIKQIWEKTPERDAVLFTDVDAIWRDDPFPIIEECLKGGASKNEANYYDMAVQMDPIKDKSKPRRKNTGFMAIPKTGKNREFLDVWQKKTEGPKQSSQYVFNIIFETEKLKVAELPLERFPHGRLFFENCDVVLDKANRKCEDLSSLGKELIKSMQSHAVVIHANGPYDKDEKIELLKKHKLWDFSPK